MHRLPRRFGLLTALTVALWPGAPSHAQTPKIESLGRLATAPGPVSPDSAALIRISLDRPPGKPPFDAADAVGLPFRVLFFPLRVVGEANAELIGVGAQIAAPKEVGFLDELAERGLLPTFGSIGERSGPAAGLRVQRFRPLYLETMVSIRGSQHHAAGLEWEGEHAHLGLGYQFDRQAEPHFWGIGPDSRESGLTDYRWDRQIASTAAGLRLGRAAFGAAAGYEDNRVARGSDDDAPDLQDASGPLPYGVLERTRYWVTRVSSSLDLTAMPGFQRRGLYGELAAFLFRGTNGTDSDFHRVRAAVNGYLPLNPRQSLALRGLAEINRLDGGTGIPFTHLARLGDERGSRAYKRSRFRDADMAAFMSEWRYEVWRELHERGRVEGFLFLDGGAVERRLAQISTSDLRWSYGFGVRLVWSKELRWLAYLAFGDDGARFDADFGWVF